MKRGRCLPLKCTHHELDVLGLPGHQVNKVGLEPLEEQTLRRQLRRMVERRGALERVGLVRAMPRPARVAYWRRACIRSLCRLRTPGHGPLLSFSFLFCHYRKQGRQVTASSEPLAPWQVATSMHFTLCPAGAPGAGWGGQPLGDPFQVVIHCALAVVQAGRAAILGVGNIMRPHTRITGLLACLLLH